MCICLCVFVKTVYECGVCVVCVCVSVTTLVSVEKPLEVHSWVREYLKQAVRQVFFLKMKMKIQILARNTPSATTPEKKKKKNGGRKMMKCYRKRKDKRSQIRCYL